MPQTKLLLLHPTPGLKRHVSYSKAAKLLEGKGYEVYFAYNGAQQKGTLADVPTYHFDSWCAKNRARIEAETVLELERNYPQANLWLAVVSERRICNYSLLDGTHPTIEYGREALEYLLKACVLFYREIIDKQGIQVIFSQHPDNIHSTILFEMGRDLPVVNFLSFPDYYWTQTSNFLFDSKYFSSTPMLATYRDYLAHYQEKVAPREPELKAFIEARNAKDPSKARPNLFPKQTLAHSIKTSWQAIKRTDHRLFWRKPGIVEGYGQSHIPTSIKAWIRKNWNAQRLRYSKIFSTEIPSKRPYVYLPLQRVPEAAMLVRATSYLNQQWLAQTLSASLPAGYQLVIKDHPRSIGIHPPSYYKKLLELPNVTLIQPGYSNQELMEGTVLLVTIAGTLGYQQLMRGQPVLMFGHKFYECLDGVMRADDMNELPYLLKDILVGGKRPDPERMRRSLNAYILTNLEHTFEAKEVAYALHHNPEALAELLDRMIQKEAYPLWQSNFEP